MLISIYVDKLGYKNTTGMLHCQGQAVHFMIGDCTFMYIREGIIIYM